MTRVPVGDLLGWTSSVLARVGLSAEDAVVVAESLVFADVRGVSTHGVLRLTTYVDRIRAGGIGRRSELAVVADFGALVVADAGAGPGAATGARAADLAVGRARSFGIGAVVCRNANHFGASGFFTNRMADAGMVGIAACNTESVMCAPFGGAPVLGTNPIAVAVPLPYASRPQLDMATTTTSQGRLIMAEQAGEPIPLGWSVDDEGRPTTSAAAGLAGALLPVGGPKGFGLAFAVDALLAVGGASVSTQVDALGGAPASTQHLGHLFIAVRADAGQSLAAYRTTVAGLVESIHASADGFDVPPAIAPGEPELRHEQAADGHVDLSRHLLLELGGLARSSDVALPPSMVAGQTAAPLSGGSTS